MINLSLGVFRFESIARLRPLRLRLATLFILVSTNQGYGLPSMRQQVVSGTVTAVTGEQIPGVSVWVKGSDETLTTTDGHGRYSIALRDGSHMLVFRSVGYQTVERMVDGNQVIDITMEEDMANLEEVVVVGYGTQRRANLTGSVATVQGTSLSKTPLASVSNTLAGRLPGLISRQSSGLPGSDGASLNIRGFGDALIIVDGVEASFNSIDPNQIESVSILKDGAAAIYGARAGNGVILIATKRGLSDRPKISLDISSSLQGNTFMPEPASAGQYTEMLREAHLQSGQPDGTAPFTQEEVDRFYAGNDPQYPNTNWREVMMRDWAPQNQYTLSARGGSERIKYFGLIGYINQESIWRKNGGEYNRFNLQSNIDASISDDVTLQLDIMSIYDYGRFPNFPQQAGAAGNIWNYLWGALPIYPAYLPNSEYLSYSRAGGVGSLEGVSNSEVGGYSHNDNQNLRGTAALNYRIKHLPGLSAKVFGNIIQNYAKSKSFLKPYSYYTYDYNADIYTLMGTSNSPSSMNMSKGEGRTITGQFSLNYDQSFREKHDVKGLAMFEIIDYYSESLRGGRNNFLTPAIDQLYAGDETTQHNNASASEMGRKSFIGRINYAYHDIYLLEATIRADASAKFPPQSRWGYFPGVSAGWVVSNERFMRGFSGVDFLKVRASYGQAGNDGVGNFQYLDGFRFGSSYMMGGVPARGMISTGLPNPYLTWENIEIANLGIEYTLLQRLLYGEIDLFYRRRTGIPATRINSLPSTFGSSLPPENINSIDDRGGEIRLGTSGKRNGFVWDVNGNISVTRSKRIHYEEPSYEDPDQERIYKQSGRWTDLTFGYIATGLFASQAQIDELPYDQDGQDNASLRPGDIVYKDLNHDGVIDWKDQDVIGLGTAPKLLFGIDVNLIFSRFDFSMLLQGAGKFYNRVNLAGKYTMAALYEMRWTEEGNNADAFVPRLGGAGTNSFTSDHFFRRADYLRLKAVSLGYALPNSWLNGLGLSNLRIYTSGTNLFTFSGLKRFGIDPEAPSGYIGEYYPQQKTISFGLRVEL